MNNKIILNKIKAHPRAVLISTPQYRTIAFEDQCDAILNHKNKIIRIFAGNFDFKNHMNKVICHAKENGATLREVLLSCERSALKGKPFCYQLGSTNQSGSDCWAAN